MDILIIMVSINNSKDLIVNSLQIVNSSGGLDDVKDVINAGLEGVVGLPPDTLNTIEAVAAAIDNNPNYFSDTQTLINTKANQSTTYTKAEVDASLSLKVNQAPYDVQVVAFNTLINSKANSIDVYTKTEVDTSLGLKANQNTTYTKTEVDTSLGLKANQSTTYTKTEVDTSLGLKANQSTTYTKTEVDTSLGLKADSSSVYTKAEVDLTVSNIVDNAPAVLNTLNELAAALNDDANYATTIQNQMNTKADKTTTYTKTEVDTALSVKMNTDDGYLKLAEGDDFILEIKPGIRIIGNSVTEEIRFNYFDLDNAIWRTLFYGKWDELNDKPILLCNNLEAISGGLITVNGNLTVTGDVTANSILGNALTQIQNTINSSISSQTYSQSQIDTSLGLKQNTLINGTIPANTGRVLVPGTSKIRSINGNNSITVVEVDDAYMTLSVDSSTVNKTFVGLGNVDNTSDVNKPVSTAQQTALNLKADITYVDSGLGTKQDTLSFFTPSGGYSLTGGSDIVRGFKYLAPITLNESANYLEIGLDKVNLANDFEPVFVAVAPLAKGLNLQSGDFELKIDPAGTITCDTANVSNNVTSSGVITNSIAANGNPQVDVNDNLTIGGTLEVVIDAGASFKTTDNGDGIILSTLATTKSIGLCSNGPAYTTGSAWIKLLSSNASPVLIRPNTNGVQLTDGASSWSSYSDEKLKNVKGVVTENLNILKGINPVKFTWKDDVRNKPCVGIIAQDVLQTLPEAVESVYDEEKKESYYTVRYCDLIPILIGAVHELRNEIDELKLLIKK